MAETTKRRNRAATPLLLLLLAALAAVAVFLVQRDGGAPEEPEATVEARFRDMTAAELEGADTADFAREIAERAALDEAYRKIARELDTYPRELLELALKNSEAAPFVADWPERSGEVWDASQIDVSADLAPGGIPHFLQWDERWGYAPYGSSLVAVSGCGPTCLAMVAAGLTGDGSVNPLAVADYSDAQGWYFPGQGTDWELMRSGAEHFGLTWRELPLDAETICAALDAGEPVIASMGPGDFTETGHFIVLVSYEARGFRVLDPNSRANSERLWPYSQISSQINNLWAYSR